VRESTLHLLLGWGAISLIAAEFVTIPMRTRVWFPEWAGTLKTFEWWAVGLVLLWVVIPALILRRDGPLPFSVTPPRTARGIALYGALIAIMLPAIALAGQRPDFLATYPLFRPAPPLTLTSDVLLVYWLCYGLILFSTEFFFRGVLLFSLESRLGVSAVGVSVLPYCLIHVHKPLPEAFGSIVAGGVLGYLALRTRSIGGGVLVHCAVAFGMDTLALVQKGQWPLGHWPFGG
jgi:membrane protease YdiL (CAAX protease family)